VKCQAILFDLGQTLLEYPASTAEQWGKFLRSRLLDMHALFAELAPELGDRDRFARQAGEIVWPEQRISMKGKSWHFRERLRAVFTEYGAECGDDDLERLTDAFYDPIGRGTQRYDETADVLDRLRSAALPLAIISNAPWDVPGRLLRGDMERWNIESYFGAMIMSGDVPWRKPNPDFMCAAAGELGVKPEGCIVVGDSLQADIAGAKAAGMQSVWVNRGGTAAPPDGPQPDWEVASLRGVLELVGVE
jgi:putative hydrolase of the HAD superfamily